MARKKRIYYPGAFYHVMLRGNVGQSIFFTEQNRRSFYSLISDGINRYGHRVHAFCLMGNHVHLAIQVGDISLSKIIHNLSFRYSRKINKQLERVGHLFQGRYKAILVESDQYVKELIRYIHLNPVRAGLTKDPDSYAWSSHHAYLGRQTISWLTSDFVLNSFAEDRGAAIKLYKAYICDKNAKIRSKLFRKGNQKGYAVLCEDVFLKKISPDDPLIRTNVTIENIVSHIANCYGVAVTDLLCSSKKRLHSEIRVLTALIAKQLNVATLSATAIYFNRDVSGLVQLVNRYGSSPDIRAKVTELMGDLQISRYKA